MTKYTDEWNAKAQVEMARLDGNDIDYDNDGLAIVISDGGCSHFDTLQELECIPDYFTDNEIDRMVRGLEWNGYDLDSPYDKYWTSLRTICGGVIHMCKATPEQKVEAFLRAHGK